MTKLTRVQKSIKVSEVASAARKVFSRERTLDDDNFGDLGEGAPEVALLTRAARSHDFEFKPVMEALQKLSKVTNWNHTYLVAHDLEGHVSFDWRRAPLRSYKSFHDFYRRELEATWGKWQRLQETWAQVIAGDITEEEGHQRIALGKREIGIAGGKAGPGRGHKTGSNTTRLLERGAAYILARLDRDGHAELAAEVRAGTISANAAAEEVGYRKRPQITCPHCGHVFSRKRTRRKPARK